MFRNDSKLKQRLKKGEIVFGTWNSIPSASLVNSIGVSGIDFIVIDAEHGPVSIETAENLIRAAQVTGMSAVVRVPANEAYWILRILDIGACGVQVPHVSTAKDARNVVRSAKYFPSGERGFSPFTRAGKYGLGADDHTQTSNANNLIVINVEGVEGVKNLDTIVEVDGIDVVFIGPYDLSQSLGIPGDVKNKRVIDHIKKSVNIVKSKGLVCGSFACDEKYLDILIDCGVHYITYMTDAALVSRCYKDLYVRFKEKAGLSNV